MGKVPEEPMMSESNEDLEVALSGGGFRAAAFGLGTLLYLVHAKLHRRVKTVCSVSGGSITSGFVAQEGGLSSFDDVEAFRSAIVQPLIVKLGGYRPAWHLANFLVVRWVFLGFLIVSGSGIALCAVPLIVAWLAEPLFGVSLRASSIGEVAAIALAAFFWWLVSLQREEVVRLWLSRTFFPAGKRLGQLSSLHVDHVFCATDLNAGRPFFFSTKGGGRLFSEAYGRGDARDVGLVDAVRGSAAFPLAIPPMHFKIHDKKFTDWKLNRDPGKIVLSDGGLWNNLGTDWSSLRRLVRLTEAEWSSRRGEGGDGRGQSLAWARSQTPAAGVLLVADASAPDEPNRYEQVKQKVPGFAEVLLIPRVLGVASSSGLVARRAGVDRTMVLETEAETREPASRHPSATDEGCEAPRTIFVEMARNSSAAAAARIRPSVWEERCSAYEKQIARPLQRLRPLMFEVERTRTVLDHLGPERVVGLLMLGYLRTREALSLAGVAHDVPEIPTREWFTDFLPLGSPSRLPPSGTPK
jgi:hypothetical protein